jgi:hypothetical protein
MFIVHDPVGAFLQKVTPMIRNALTKWILPWEFWELCRW